MKLINRALFILTIIAWTAFFLEIWNVTNYWAGVAIIFGLLFITAGYLLTKPSSIKVMTEDEPEQSIEYIDEPVDWQECYKIAERDEFNRKAEKIIKEVSEACYEIGKGDYDAPRI